MAADRDRQRTYDAEHRAFIGTLAEEALTFAEVADLVRAVTASPWWRAHGPGPVRVERGRAGMVHSRHVVGTDRIIVTEVQQTPATVAHELAHVCAPDQHGPRFRGAMLAITALVCGPEAAGALADEFRAGGLSVAPSPPSPAQTRAILADHPRFGA